MNCSCEKIPCQVWKLNLAIDRYIRTIQVLLLMEISKPPYRVSRTQKGILFLLLFLISIKHLMVNDISLYLRYKYYFKIECEYFLITKISDEGWIKIPV